MSVSVEGQDQGPGPLEQTVHGLTETGRGIGQGAGDIVDTTGDVAGSAWNGTKNVAGSVLRTAGDTTGSVLNAGGNLLNNAGRMVTPGSG